MRAGACGREQIGMLYVLLTWCYIFITAFPVGFCVAELAGSGARRSMEGALMAGLSALMVYAQLFILAGGVGMEANLLLLLVCFL